MFLNIFKKKETFWWVVLIILVLIPRVYKLGWDFHGIDSDRWFRRAVSFQDNLLKGDFSGTYQKQHPGVTLMWLGGFGYKLLTSIYLRIYHTGIDENIYYLFPLINFSIKLPLILADVFLMLLTFVLTKKAFNKKCALLFLLLISIDQFFFFHSRVFHLDVLMSLLSFVSILFLILFRKTQHYNHLILSAFMAGLAFLTKTTAGIFIFLQALYIIYAARNSLKKIVKDLSIFSLIFLITYLLLFPANWINPIETTRKVIEKSYGTGFIDSNVIHLFNNPYANIAPKFYLLVFLFRFSPVLVFLIITAIIINLKNILMGKFNFRNLKEAEIFMFITLVVFISVIIKTGKIYERYIIPTILFLTFFASYYWSKFISERLLKSLTIGALLLFLIISVRKHPNYAIYNTLFGGAKTQMKIFSELGACTAKIYEVADFINKKEKGADNFEVAISGVYEICLNQFLSGRTVNFRNAKLPKYYVLFKTDTPLFTDRKIINSYKLIKVFNLYNVPFYYVYERKT